MESAWASAIARKCRIRGINNYQDKEGALVLGRGASKASGIGLRSREWPAIPSGSTIPRFATQKDRAENAEALIANLDEAFATKTRAEWTPIFEAEEDMWWSPVQNLEEVMADEQVKAAGGFCEVPDGGATTLLPSSPCDFAGTPWAPRWMAPEQGQHTDEVLGEMGRRCRDDRGASNEGSRRLARGEAGQKRVPETDRALRPSARGRSR